MNKTVWTDADRARLRRRAEALAAPLDAPAAAPELAVQICAGRDQYALPTASVLAVRPLLRLTPIPGAGLPFAGLFASGERILPAFSLAGVLGAAAVPGEKSYVVELGDAEAELGLVVEDVLAFAEYTADAAPRAPAEQPEGEGALPVGVLGQTTDGVSVLDVAALLAGTLLHISSTSDNSLRKTRS